MGNGGYRQSLLPLEKKNAIGREHASKLDLFREHQVFSFFPCPTHVKTNYVKIVSKLTMMFISYSQRN